MNRRLVVAGVVISTLVLGVAFAGSGWAVDGAPARDKATGGKPTRSPRQHLPVRVACGDVAGLKAAINAANASPTEPTTIRLATRCTYTLTSVDNGVNGLPVVRSPLTIEGKGSTIVRSSAAGTAAFRIWQVGTDGALTLRSVVIAGGEALAGGGIHNGGRLTLEKSAVTRNTATAGGDATGGGIFNAGTATLDHSQLTANAVTSTDGVASGGGLANQGNALLQFTRVSGNSTRSSGDSAVGSGMSNSVDSTLTVNFSKVDHNTANSPTFAGGTAIDTAGTVTLNHSDVSRNSATSAGTAAAALFHVGALLTLNKSRVFANTATGSGVVGAGINTGGTLDVIGSRVIGNIATNTTAGTFASGGGIFVTGGTTRVIGSTVTRNKALGPNAQGGGIATLGAATATLDRSTVRANVPDNCDPPGSIAGCVG